MSDPVRTAAMAPTEREAFEAWASQPHLEIDLTPNIHSNSKARYASVETNVLLEGWLARAAWQARAALPVEQPAGWKLMGWLCGQNFITEPPKPGFEQYFEPLYAASPSLPDQPTEDSVHST